MGRSRRTQPAPGQAAPGQAAPGQAAPGQAGPGQPAPGQPAPGLPATGQAGGGSSIGQAAMSRLRGFLGFWYDFVVGDDWLVAAGVLVALVLTYAVSRTAVPAWWLMPAAVGMLLPASLRRLTRRR